jgi:hypothetical protein
MARALLPLLGFLLCASLLSPPAAAQGGYRTEEFPDLGLELPIPRNYKALPLEPTERWMVLRWIDERTAERTAAATGQPLTRIFAPEFTVLWIDHVPDPVVTPGSDSGGDPGGDPGGGDPGAAPEADPFERPINSFERYLEAHWSRDGRPLYTLDAGRAHDDQDGNQLVEHVLEPFAGQPPAWAAICRTPLRSLVFFGRCSKEDWDDQQSIWRTMLRRARFPAAVAADMGKWQRFYEKRPELIDASYRLQVRSKLVRGWEADDTEHYIFVYSTRDEPLLRDLKKKMEAIRAEYERLFPPSAPVTAVSTVRICRDRAEYIQYGGSPWSGGYWNSSARELVFFDYKEEQEAKGEGTANSRIVLFHEAFHQYIYYSVGELPPHSWYNEGTGDFFSGAVISGSRVSSIGVNPWRVGFIQAIARDQPEKLIPLEELFAFEQAEFYRPDRRSVCYAQAWSLIYFLRTAQAAEREPTYARILPVYFDTLKSSFQRRMAELGEQPAPEATFLVGKQARDEALAAALDGVDLSALQRDWQRHLLGLRVPR